MLRYDSDDTFGENNFGINEELWDIIVKATKLNREERYQSAEEMRDALDAISIKPKAVTFSDTKMFRSIIKAQSTLPISPTERAKAPSSGKKRGAIIAAASVAAAAAVIVPITVNNLGKGVPSSSYSDTSEAVSSDVVSSEAVSSEPVSSNVASSEPVSEAEPVPLTETFPYFGEYESKAWYHNLNENEREAYKIVYDGLCRGGREIVFPERKYKYSEVSAGYWMCIYDNPWLCNIGDFGKTYNDDNDNKLLDDDDYILSIQPDYLQFNMKPEVLSAAIEVNTYGIDDPLEGLLRVHDAMTQDIMVVARYSTQACTHAYGSIVYKQADDMGIAQGFCVYAQAMGIPCRVIDGTKNGEMRAWCAVKLEDKWYNVDVYGDMFAQNEISEIPLEGGHVFHTYFLASDDYFKTLGYEPEGGWEVLGGKEFAADSPYDNYYIQAVSGVVGYITRDAQSVYDALLQKVAEAKDSGTKEFSLCAAHNLINDLSKQITKRFISDCSEKFGLTVSGYKLRYHPDTYTVTINV